MQEVFEKIIEKIKKLTHDNPMITDNYILREEAIEIVKQTATEYNNGWIPCSERLPEDGEPVLATDGNYVYLVEYDADLDASFGDMDGIVAWRPLPDPYHPEGRVRSSMKLCKDFELKKQTNADRIRAMTDEELAELITSGELSAICPFCKYYGTKNCYMENEGAHKNCSRGIIAWLQSEVEV